MKFISLKGRAYAVDIRPSYWKPRSLADCKSQFQWRVGVVVEKLFPDYNVLEDFYVPGESLYLDFFIPSKMLAVEANGTQHESYNEFFHGSRDGYKRAVERDSRKRLWCALNRISLVIINYGDSDLVIVDKIKAR